MGTPDVAADVVILAGGRGTRLESVPGDMPKPLRPVNGRPFVEYLIDQVRAAGLRRIILSLGHKPEAFDPLIAREGLLKSVEASPMGTGGGLRAALPLLHAPTILVMNGDSYANVDLRVPVAVHRRRRGLATMLLAEVEDTARFGRVEIGEDGVIEQFAEKGQAGPGLINAGVYVLSKSVIEQIPADRAVSLERETFPSLIGRGFYAEAGSFAFMDIGTPESYAASAEFFQKTRSR